MSSLGHAIALPFVFELASMPLYSIWYCNAVAVLFVLLLMAIELLRSPCKLSVTIQQHPPLFYNPKPLLFQVQRALHQRARYPRPLPVRTRFPDLRQRLLHFSYHYCEVCVWPSLQP